MTRHDATTAEILVFTFRDGLLSAVAHDLKIRVGRFTIEVDGDQFRASMDAASLQVVCAMKDGAEYPSGLPSRALPEIERNIQQAVLKPTVHPTIRFESTGVTAEAVEGQLSLHGVTRPVRGLRRDGGGRQVAEFRFDQRDFGIKPFTAMLGTLKVKPELKVRVSLPKGPTP